MVELETGSADNKLVVVPKTIKKTKDNRKYAKVDVILFACL
jgi:hypothetical protein